MAYASGGLDFLRSLYSLGGSDRYSASAASSEMAAEDLPLSYSLAGRVVGFLTVPVRAKRNFKSLIFALLAAVLASRVKSAPPQFVFVLSLLSTNPCASKTLGAVGAPAGGGSTDVAAWDSLPLGFGYKSYLPSSSFPGVL